MRKSTLSVIFALMISLFAMTGCINRFHFQNEDLSKEPGSALPVTVCYEGSIFSHDGYVIYELPENVEFIGKTKKTRDSQISENYDANESGSLYKESNTNDVLYFQYDNWDEEIDGGKEPYLLLYQKSK